MVDIVVDAMVQWADAMVDTLLDTLLDTIVDAIVDDATVDAMQWLRSSVSQKSLGLPLHLPWHVSVLSAVCCPSAMIPLQCTLILPGAILRSHCVHLWRPCTFLFSCVSS